MMASRHLRTNVLPPMPRAFPRFPALLVALGGFLAGALPGTSEAPPTPPVPPDPPVWTINFPFLVHQEGDDPIIAGEAPATTAIAWRALWPFLVWTVLASRGAVQSGATTIEAETAGLASILTPADRCGVHLHPRKVLQDSASPPVSPNVLQPSNAGPTTDDVTGYSTHVSALSTAQCRALLVPEKAHVVALGHPAPKCFAAGYFLTSTATTAALAAEGFTHDASPVPSSALSAGYSAYTIAQIAARWPSVTTTGPRPYLENGVVQVPSSSAVSEYWAVAADLFEAMKAAALAAKARPDKQAVFPLVAHWGASFLTGINVLHPALLSFHAWASSDPEAAGLVITSTRLDAIGAAP